MGNRIRGITVEFDGDASGIGKALKGVNSEAKNVEKQLKDVEKLLKLDPTNTELLRQKQALLAKSVETTKSKVEELRKAEQAMKDAGVDKNSAQFMALQREIISTENELDNLKEAAKQSNVALEKIGATAEKISGGAQKVADATAGLSKAAQGVLAAAGGVAAAAVKSYADNEQLIGGIETLYGKSAEQLKRYANEAYKTSGMSANQYMELSTSFAASLVQSLGGETGKAATYANMAITDMADNANKMGSDIDSLQAAYQGFAKGQYTLLDNLKLGYGGTATEMARLLNDSGVLGDNVIDITKDVGKQLSEIGLDQIIVAIHTIQEEMDVTGTTAAEAAKTISGSFESAKAAIGNLVTGLGQEGADIDALTKNAVDSVVTMVDNILPVLKNLWDNLPGGVKAGLSITGALAVLSPIFSVISKASSAIGTVTGLLQKVGPVIGTVTGELGKLFSKVAGFVASNPIVLIGAAVTALVALIATKGDEIQGILQKVDDFLQGVFAKDWTEIFGPVLGEILNGFFANFKNVWDSVKQVLDGVIDIIRGVFTGDWKRAWEGVKEVFGGIFNGLLSVVKAPLNGIITMLNGVIDGVNWVIKGLNKLPNVNIGEVGKIPYLASGGILSRGSAIVGEAGPELLTMAAGKAYVQPLSGGPNLGTVEGLLGNIRDSIGGSGSPIHITVQSVLDGKVIGETAYQYSAQKARAGR